MGTHPIFESDFDCLTEMRFSLVRLNYRVPELGKWYKQTGDYNAGKHILPPKISESEREEAIQDLWTEAKNEMWLVRHKRKNNPKMVKPRLSFQKNISSMDNKVESKRISHELALGPDVTYEDRFMNIAKRGHQWSKPTFVKYPDLQKHLESSLNPKKMHYRYPQPVEKPLSWRDIKG